MSLKDDIENARNIATAIRPMWPQKAAELDRLIEAAETGKSDSIRVTATVHYTLEKFAGEFEPGKTPYETIQGQG